MCTKPPRAVLAEIVQVIISTLNIDTKKEEKMNKLSTHRHTPDILGPFIMSRGVGFSLCEVKGHTQHKDQKRLEGQRMTDINNLHHSTHHFRLKK